MKNLKIKKKTKQKNPPLAWHITNFFCAHCFRFFLWNFHRSIYFLVVFVFRLVFFFFICCLGSLAMQTCVNTHSFQLYYYIGFFLSSLRRRRLPSESDQQCEKETESHSHTQKKSKMLFCVCLVWTNEAWNIVWYSVLVNCQRSDKQFCFVDIIRLSCHMYEYAQCVGNRLLFHYYFRKLGRCGEEGGWSYDI